MCLHTNTVSFTKLSSIHFWKILNFIGVRNFISAVVRIFFHIFNLTQKIICSFLSSTMINILGYYNVYLLDTIEKKSKLTDH